MLVLCNVDPPGLLVQLLIIPRGVHSGKLSGNVVVLAEEEVVE